MGLGEGRRAGSGPGRRGAVRAVSGSLEGREWESRAPRRRETCFDFHLRRRISTRRSRTLTADDGSLVHLSSTVGLGLPRARALPAPGLCGRGTTRVWDRGGVSGRSLGSCQGPLHPREWGKHLPFDSVRPLPAECTPRVHPPLGPGSGTESRSHP